MALFSIPKIVGEPLEFEFNTGDVLFVLGANGTGKSSLMFRFNRERRPNTRWISAHRQSWFASSSVSLTPHDKKQAEHNLQAYDANASARWMDFNPGARPSIAVYELIEAENVDSRAIARAVRAGQDDLVQQLKRKDAPLVVINELLRSSNLQIELSIQDDEQVMASKAGSAPFSFNRLSDGERNALIVAANVLTAKPGTLILVDEPERHLHRSIISPLLTQLFRRRSDCAFIISTHELLLPLDNPDARTLLVRACMYTGENVGGWDADLVPSDVEVDEVLKVDILGSRKKILFVEGSQTGRSLDQPFYSLVFPGVSVIGKSGCRDVEHAVTGVRAAANLHWISAFGVIDSDGRDASEIGHLKSRGIYAVPAYSVEALYYDPDIQRRVAERHAAVVGRDPRDILTNAQNSALEVLGAHADRMARKVSEKTIQGCVMRQMPRSQDIESGGPVEIRVDVAAEVNKERAIFDSALRARDLGALIRRYPLRETEALVRIARLLGFQNREQYEGAVLKLLNDDAAAVNYIRSLFNDLWASISAT